MIREVNYSDRQAQNSLHKQTQRRRLESLSREKDVEVNRDRNWNHQEISKLTGFLKDHRNAFDNYKAKRALKIYKILSQHMKTRNSNQCRTYMKKMLNHFGDVDKILVFLDNVVHSYSAHPLRQKEQKLEERMQDPRGQPQVDYAKNDGNHKIEDHELGPTGTQYEQQGNLTVPLRTRKSFFEDDNFQNVNQIELHPLDTHISDPQIKRSIQDATYPFFSIEGIKKCIDQRDKENVERLWAECHQTFQQWVDSLRRLLQKRKK